MFLFLCVCLVDAYIVFLTPYHRRNVIETFRVNQTIQITFLRQENKACITVFAGVFKLIILSCSGVQNAFKSYPLSTAKENIITFSKCQNAITFAPRAKYSVFLSLAKGTKYASNNG